MLSPKKIKFRKRHRCEYRHLDKIATRTNKLDFGEYGLVAMSGGLITDRQIEAARVALTRTIRRGGKVWIRVFPSYPYTKKPAETRMGKGKGSLDYWCVPVKPGTVLFEVTGIAQELAAKAVQRAIAKLPIKARFLTRG